MMFYQNILFTQDECDVMRNVNRDFKSISKEDNGSVSYKSFRNTHDAIVRDSLTLNLILKKLKPIGLCSLPMVHYQITYGGRFAPHTDVTSDPRFKTIVVLLSPSTEYSGGVLSIEGSSVNTNQGNVIVFDVRKLHEVSELVSGERHTLVMWTNKDNFNIPKTIL